YDAVFGEMGGERKFRNGDWIAYGDRGRDGNSVYVCPPFNKEAASFGNGMMLGFKANDKAEVDAAYRAGLAHGGTDEGPPGPRPADARTFYGAYVRDPVGNKICVFCVP